MNGDDPGADFYKGLNFLGRPVNVGLTGESPVGTPASGVSAIPSAGVGATAPAKGAAEATGPAGPAGPSSIQQALQALGLTSKALTAAGKVSGTPEGPGAAATPEVPRGVTPDAATSLPGGPAEIGHEVIPPAEPLPVGQPVAETIEGVGAETAPAQGASAAGEGAAEGAAAGAEGPLGWAALVALAALQAAGVNVPTSAGGIGKTLGIKDPNVSTGLDLAFAAFNPVQAGFDLAHLFGPPPATAFPLENLKTLESSVGAQLPKPLTAPAGASPEVQKWIDATNQQIDKIKTTYSYAGLSPSFIQSSPQSAESWNNAWQATMAELSAEFAQLQGLYGTAQQGMSGLPVPSEIPSDRAVWGASPTTGDVLSGFPQLTTPPTPQKPPPAPTPGPTSSFFRGTEKLPEQ